jgi:peptidoglycan-N-acetylglucosamine deacetylase
MLIEKPAGPLCTARKITVSFPLSEDIRTRMLREREILLTFDDGPSPPCTETVLATLAAEEVKATFFLVGCRARRFPDLVRRIAADGHTVGSHTEFHQGLSSLTAEEQKKEIDQGIASIEGALGHSAAIAPAFRFPYLKSTPELEAYLASRKITVWAADVVSEDWQNTSADQVANRILGELERVGKGIILMHDNQPKMALALPKLLREFKRRDYRVVHAASFVCL